MARWFAVTVRTATSLLGLTPTAAELTQTTVRPVFRLFLASFARCGVPAAVTLRYGRRAWINKSVGTHTDTARRCRGNVTVIGVRNDGRNVVRTVKLNGRLWSPAAVVMAILRRGSSSSSSSSDGVGR